MAPPWFLFHLIPGLHLSPLTWVTHVNKGCICEDATNLISPTNDGAAPNSAIPAPGIPGCSDKTPLVFYATALKRHLTWLWNLRISHLSADILHHSENIQSALHCVLHHPYLVIVFPHVFEFLLVLVGANFGTKNSPSLYCVPMDARGHLAACTTFPPTMPSYKKSAFHLQLTLPLTPRQPSQLVPVFPDSCHCRISSPMRHCYHHAPFVDNNATADIATHMRVAVRKSVLSAYYGFGFPAAIIALLALMGSHCRG